MLSIKSLLFLYCCYTLVECECMKEISLSPQQKLTFFNIALIMKKVPRCVVPVVQLI